MRPPLRTLLALALLTAVTGCGGDESSESEAGGGASPAASSAAASPSPVAITEATATAAAEKINLTAADLPGFTASPPDETEDPAADKAEDELNACVGTSTAEPIAEVASDDFAKGTDLPSLSYSSEVAFVADAATVESDLAALKSEKALPCVAAFVKKAFGGAEEGVTISEPKTTRLMPTAGGEDATGLRITSEISAAGQKIPLTFDLLAFGAGRSEISLIVAATGTSIDQEQEQALFAKLVERATANAL